MHIADVLRRKGHDVVTIHAHETTHDAICRMNEHRIGALLVTGRDDGIVGIITERDILRTCGERCGEAAHSVTRGGGACTTPIREVMTKDLIIGLPSDDLHYVMGVMTENRIRHLPVVSDGALVGLISIGDVVNAMVEQKELENRQLKDYIQGTTY